MGASLRSFTSVILPTMHTKMQKCNEAGCVCDVLCNDYYQIMSCPEWDDADFTGDYFSTDFPAWHRVDLHGFQRPKWFIQGPFEMCNKLLLAKNHGHILSEILWRRRVASFCKKQSESVANGTTKSSDALKRTTSKHSFVFDKFNTLSCFIKYVAQTFSSSKLFSLRLKRALKKLFMTKDERVEEKKKICTRIRSRATNEILEVACAISKRTD